MHMCVNTEFLSEFHVIFLTLHFHYTGWLSVTNLKEFPDVKNVPQAVIK